MVNLFIKLCKLGLPPAIIGFFTLSSLPLLASEYAWLAFGDLRGNIESCGCDPATDLGGIARLGAQLAMDRRLNPEVLVFDLGNNFDPESTNLTKRKFLAKALAELKSNARLLNQEELSLESFLNKGADFVLSNKKAGSILKTKPFLIEKNILIFGYFFSPHDQTNLARFDVKLASEWQKIQRENPKNHKILLFSGPNEDLQAIAKSKLFDEIIRSNPNSGRTFDAKEKENPNILAVLLDKKLSFHVPLAGVGILRGGKAQESEAQSLSAIFKDLDGSKNKSLEMEKGFFKEAKIVTWLGADLQKESPFTDLMLAYEEELAKEFSQSLKDRDEAHQKSNYIGSNACKGCHSDSAKIFDHSAHAKAFETLKKVGKQNNPECVRCHVVGFAKGGFVSEAQTPELAGVGCETCHEPRKIHILDQKRAQKKGAAKKVCQNCHINPHSSAFDFDKYWAKIKHP